MENETEKRPLYRSSLLRNAKSRAGRSWYGKTIADIAVEVNLSENTVKDALKGKAKKIDVLKTLADYFEIDWLQLFDVENRFTVLDRDNLAEDFAGYVTKAGKPKATRQNAWTAPADLSDNDVPLYLTADWFISRIGGEKTTEGAGE